MPSLPLPNVWELHPMLVHFPIALLLAAVAADLFGRKRETVRRAAAGLLVAGVSLGWIAAGAGAVSYFTVPAHTEAAHVQMTWHWVSALATLGLFTVLAAVRWRRRAEPVGGGAVAGELLAAALLLWVGYLGGAMVYHGGAGVAPDLLAPKVREGHRHGSSGQGGDAHGGGEGGNAAAGHHGE